MMELIDFLWNCESSFSQSDDYNEERFEIIKSDIKSV